MNSDSEISPHRQPCSALTRLGAHVTCTDQVKVMPVLKEPSDQRADHADQSKSRPRPPEEVKDSANNVLTSYNQVG